MKRWKWIALIAAAAAVPLLVLAAEPGDNAPQGDRGPGMGPGGGVNVIRLFDANGDGQISEGEWTDAFRKLDANSDGVVTREELEQFAQQQREQYWKSLDKNGDGAITLDEFPGREEGFKRLDPNGDGKLTSDEIKAAHERMRQRREGRRNEGGGDSGTGQ